MFPQPRPQEAGDLSFETASITTPFTPSPSWSHVGQTPFTPPSPTRPPRGQTISFGVDDLESGDDPDSPFYIVPRARLNKGKGKEGATDPKADAIYATSPSQPEWPAPLVIPQPRPRISITAAYRIAHFLLEESLVIDTDRLMFACRFPTPTQNCGQMIVQGLFDELTLPSKRKQEGKVTPKSILEAKDKAFRKSPALLRCLDICARTTHAVLHELLEVNLSDTVRPSDKPALYNCRWVRIKSELLDDVRMEAGLSYPDPIPQNLFNGVIQVLANAISPQFALCVSQPFIPPLFTGRKSKDPMTLHLRYGVTEFMRKLTTAVKPTVHYYHDVKQNSYIPINLHCDTVIEIAKREPEPSSHLSLKEANAILWKRYTEWSVTLLEIFEPVITIDDGRTITIRHADRLFPTPPSDPNSPFKFSTCFAERLASLAYFDPKKMTNRWETRDPAEMEAASQAMAQARVEKLDESTIYRNIVRKIKQVVKVDNSGDWEICPCCWQRF